MWVPATARPPEEPEMCSYGTSSMFQQLNKNLFSFQQPEGLCLLLLSVQSLVNMVKSWVAGFVAALKCGMIIILGREEEA